MSRAFFITALSYYVYIPSLHACPLPPHAGQIAHSSHRGAQSLDGIDDDGKLAFVFLRCFASRQQLYPERANGRWLGGCL